MRRKALRRKLEEELRPTRRLLAGVEKKLANERFVAKRAGKSGEAANVNVKMRWRKSLQLKRNSPRCKHYCSVPERRRCCCSAALLLFTFSILQRFVNCITPVLAGFSADE